MAAGSLTSGQVLALQTELQRGVERYNEKDRNWRSVLCKQTTDTTMEVYQRSMSMQQIGETGTPDMQRLASQTITLAAPKRYGIWVGVTQSALDNDVTEEQVREQHAEALQADYRRVTATCLQACFDDGGWWDATATPPNWAQNTFTSGHDHYHAYNVAGVATLAHFTTAKREITEHGWGLDGGMVGFINGDMAVNIENLAEWATAPGPMPTTVMDKLQAMGLTPEFKAAGLPIVACDWIPENYALVIDLNAKALRWRNPRGRAKNGNLQAYSEPSDIRYQVSEGYVRWASATVGLRSCGVPIYFGSGTYAAPTLTT